MRIFRKYELRTLFFISLMTFENTETNSETRKAMKKQVNFFIPVLPWLMYTIKTQCKRFANALKDCSNTHLRQRIITSVSPAFLY